MATQQQGDFLALEQENARLKARLQACEQSHARLQAEVARYRQSEAPRSPIATIRETKFSEQQRTQQALLEAEQVRVAELAKANEALQQRAREVQQSYRLLSTVAEVTRDLLENCQVEVAIAQVLQRIGEAAGISRMTLMQERIESCSGRRQHYVIEEWHGSGVPRQMDDPVTRAVYNDDYIVLIDDLRAGRSVWSILEDLPEPARTQQANLEVKSTGAVPIFIEGEYLGCVAFDDCVDYRQWTAYEIDVLTSAAGAIGAALHRKQLGDRLVSEQVRAEQERVTQLAKANTTLKKTLDVLATEPMIDRSLGHVLRVLTEQLESSSSALWLYDPDRQRFSLHLVDLDGAIIAAAPETINRLSGQWTRGGELPRDLTFKQHIRDRKPVIYDVADLPESSRQFMHRLGIKTLLGVPLLLGSEIIGSFTVRFTASRQFQAEELELTQALAHQATLALQLTQLSALAQHETQQAAILGERNRMARELHDTLAQTFTGIIMQLEATQEMIMPTTFEPAQKHLDRAGLLARQGLQEARRSVWSLRSEVLESGDLPTALLRIAQQMTDHTTIQTDVIVDGTPIDLSAALEDHLLRIGQEALTNALKHAESQKIQIRLRFADDSVQLQVVDDGRGFDPQQQWRGYGMTSMEERTRQIGGEFSLKSRIGQGTTIQVSIPLGPSEARA